MFEQSSTFTNNQQFDYIITGAGCAGLSLLMRILQHPYLSTKKVLVIESDEKNRNDRTWCFWETSPGPFESIVNHRWNQIDFYSSSFSRRFEIEPYSYKMIRGADFYAYVINKAKQNPSIFFLKAKVEAVGNEGHQAFAVCNQQRYYAQYVFNSILFEDISQYPLKEGGFYYLLQHFKGWVIETTADCFNPDAATFMDFRVPQTEGTTFAYVLPVTANKALVEYTLFSPALLATEAYDKGLRNYISDFLKIDDYKICEEEFGVIPMTNFPFQKGEGNVVNIGTAGGQTKGSSGFTFHFIQKHSDELIQALLNHRDPHIKKTLTQKRFDLYDSTLLQILTQKKSSGDKIFTDLFSSNKAQDVLRFLDNETSVSEELKIMSAVSSAVFIPAAFKEMFKGI